MSAFDHATLKVKKVVKLHEHKNDEILSYMWSGTMVHEDSAGHRIPISANKLMMNAGASGAATWYCRSKNLTRSCPRGTMFQGVTPMSVPVLSPPCESMLILTGGGHSHGLDDDAVGALRRALQCTAGRRSDSLFLLRLG